MLAASLGAGALAAAGMLAAPALSASASPAGPAVVAAHAARASAGTMFVQSSPSRVITAAGLVAENHPLIHRSFSSDSIVNPSHSNKCVITNGQGNQVTVGTSGCGNFTSHTDNSNCSGCIVITDGNGNALRGTTGGIGEIGNGAPNYSDPGTGWELNEPASDDLVNFGWNQLVGTPDVNNGTGLVDIFNHTGYFFWHSA
jgi:hypothetical protein